MYTLKNHYSFIRVETFICGKLTSINYNNAEQLFIKMTF